MPYSTHCNFDENGTPRQLISMPTVLFFQPIPATADNSLWRCRGGSTGKYVRANYDVTKVILGFVFQGFCAKVASGHNLSLPSWRKTL